MAAKDLNGVLAKEISMDSDGWVLLVAGMILGGFAVYMVMKNTLGLKATTTSATAAANMGTSVIAEPVETVEWKDYKGNIHRMATHREVRA